MCLEQWAKWRDFDLAGATLAVQGFGKVGSHVAKTLSRLGTSLVSVADHTGHLYNAEGFNPYKLAEYCATHGSLEGYPTGDRVSREEFFSTPCDIFVPAATHLQIGGHEAADLPCRVVAEAANGPTDLEGERILSERGIDLIPDILCNSGGVVVSYCEWLQNGRNERWEKTEVHSKLERRMIKTIQEARERASDLDCDLRTGCYALALERLSAMIERRGIWP
jgi:glutamate dehydrogenase (NAD(P)+)